MDLLARALLHAVIGAQRPQREVQQWPLHPRQPALGGSIPIQGAVVSPHVDHLDIGCCAGYRL